MTETQASPESTTEAVEPAPVELPWRPLRFVQFGYAERNSKERSLLRMNIQLPAQRVRKEQNHLDVWVDHSTRRVHFGPEGGLQVEPWNRGIGRFLVAQAAIWAQKK